MEKASACARAVKPEAKILPKKEEMPACGQRALARVSYMTSTRAKAQLIPTAQLIDLYPFSICD